jgi:hypothetical protein
MALNDKNIIVTPNIGSSSSDPRIDFRGADSTSGPNIISAVAYPLNSGTLSFEGTAGQLFSITNNLTSGSIFSVNDVSGIPSIDVNANGTVSMVSYGGSVGVGLTNPAYKLQLSTDSAAKPSTSTWTISSDERIKEDIVPADLDICYNTLKSIPLKYYKWNDDVYSSNVTRDRHKLGWIAQDVETVFPKAVNQFELRYNKKTYEDYIVPAAEEVIGIVTPAQPERTEQREVITYEDYIVPAVEEVLGVIAPGQPERTEQREVITYEDYIVPAVEEILDEDGNVVTPAQPERTEQREVITYEDYIVPAVEEVLGVITPGQPERTEQREIITYEDYIVPAVEEVLGVIIPAQPERTEQREIITEEIIPDCRDLNVDQIYAVMYGAIQKLINKIETLEEEVNTLKNS